MTDDMPDTSPGTIKNHPEGAMFFVPDNKSRCTIGGPNGLVITSPTPAPNRFWRVMQRWCLGIVWEVLDDE